MASFFAPVYERLDLHTTSTVTFYSCHARQVQTILDCSVHCTVLTVLHYSRARVWRPASIPLLKLATLERFVHSRLTCIPSRSFLALLHVNASAIPPLVSCVCTHIYSIVTSYTSYCICLLPVLTWKLLRTVHASFTQISANFPDLLSTIINRLSILGFQALYFVSGLTFIQAYLLCFPACSSSSACSV